MSWVLFQKIPAQGREYPHPMVLFSLCLNTIFQQRFSQPSRVISWPMLQSMLVATISIAFASQSFRSLLWKCKRSLSGAGHVGSCTNEGPKGEIYDYSCRPLNYNQYS